MAKPTDQFGLVERVGGDLHATHCCHVAEEGEELRRCGLDGARWQFAFVEGEWNGGGDRDWQTLLCGVFFSLLGFGSGGLVS